MRGWQGSRSPWRIDRLAVEVEPGQYGSLTVKPQTGTPSACLHLWRRRDALPELPFELGRFCMLMVVFMLGAPQEICDVAEPTSIDLQKSNTR
jgi:hypothetical protein